MRIVLNKLKLENYKKHKHLEIDFQGRNALIRAQNRIGKTTIYDAFLWLLFGKDSKGRTDYDIRPLDGDNQPIKGLVLAVEAELVCNGVVMVFRKEQDEKVSKAGNVSYPKEHKINEVPMLEKDYKTEIGKIIPESIFRQLSALSYFNSKMKWEDRRKVLLDIAGQVSKPAGFDRLLELLEGRTIADFSKVLKDRKKAYEKERDEIKPRLDEIQLSLDQYAQNDSTEDVEVQRDVCKEKKVALEAKRDVLRNSEAERNGHVEDIIQRKSKRSHRETILKNQTGPVDALRDEIAAIKGSHNDKELVLLDLRSLIRGIETAMVSSKNTIEASLLTLQTIKKEHEAAKSISDSSLYDRAVMHTCDCELAEEDLREEAAAYVDDKDNKQKATLYVITNRGRQIRESIEACKAEQDEQQTELNIMLEKETAMKVDIAQSAEVMNKRIAEIDEAIKNKPEPDPKEDAEWKILTAEIITIEVKLGEPLTVQIASINEEIRFANELLEKLNECLNQADAIKKSNARIAELEAKEVDLGQRIATIEGQLDEVDRYSAEQNNLIQAAVNGLFEHVTYKLFDFYLNEGYKPCCVAVLDGVSYPGMSTGEEMFSNIDVINTLSSHYGVEVPLFVDNTESMTLPLEAESQVIKLEAVKGVKELEITFDEKEVA